jgi:hypothetical protein
MATSLTEAITAGTSAATSDAISLSGPVEIHVEGTLLDGEYVEIKRDNLANTFEGAKTGSGIIRLTSTMPSVIYEGYSDIKIYKTATENSVGVSYATS